ncbi:MAG: Ig-like domain-containing protein [Chitinophagales bacterium]
MTGSVTRLFLLALLMIFITQCATVTSPTGGPKDQLPPRLMSSTTENFATNFNASAIILTFDEFVKLSNPSQNIHTSPPLGKKVEFTTVKNKLFITFKEALEEDLTYHINFGNSIQDVNEGNPLNNFQFIFSTGPKIDSMSIQGKLIPVNDVKINKTTLVGLYRNTTEDSVFLREAPFYYTFVDDAGSFTFRNIKNGTYTIRALSDANGNRYFDLPNESIGFLKDAIQLDSNIFNVEILLFKAENPNRRVTEFTNNIKEYTSEYILSNPIAPKDSFELIFLPDTVQLNATTILKEDGKTINVFFDQQIQSLNQIETILKINGEVIDTLTQSISNLKSPKQEFSFTREDFLIFDTLSLKSTVPLASVCENIQIIDTIELDTLAFLGTLNIDNQLDISLLSRLKTNHVYTLLIQDSCLIDVLGRPNIEINKNFKTASEEDRGTLKLIFEEVDSATNYLVSFLNSNKNVVAQTTISKNENIWNLSYLTPGTYSIKIVEDDNKDGIWNSGTYIGKKFPETIYVHSKEITIRANWELEESINLKTQ